LRLNQIDIFGFKSFAQKVQIPFGPGTTAIVGPNGCGKSNVVEALRWVLGEQRAGAFRSQRMEDVIFSGTRQRKALGMSEVSVVIDNASHMLPIDYTEVTLTRRLFRSGESDYLLNKVPCRLLDIQNLLMDTGLGPGAYSVMEQGMVDEIISDKTENRRRILEEAAGITKYKVRRRSTWSRLESVNADLTQLEAVIAEVKRQVDIMNRQVGKAQRYQELKTELDQVEIHLGRFQFFSLNAELRPLEEEFNRLRDLSESGYTGLTAREAELEKNRLHETEAEKALQEVAIALNRCTEEIHQKDRQLVSSQEQRKARQQSVERATNEKSEYSRQLENSVQQRQEVNETLTASVEALETIQERHQALEAKASTAETQYQQCRTTLDQAKAREMALIRQQNDHSRIQERLRAESEAQQNRRVQLDQELDQIKEECQQLANAAAQARSECQAHAARRIQAERLLHDVQAKLADLANDRRRLDEERNNVRRLLTADQARLQALEKVRSRYEGYSTGVRTLILDSPYKDRFEGVLGDLLDVDPRYQRGLEIALGDALDALVAQEAQGLLETLDFLKEHSGRASVFPLDWQGGPLPQTYTPPAFPGLIGLLRDQVQATAAIAPLLDRLLHNTFMVEALDPTLNLAKESQPQGVRFITPEGDAIELNGRLVGGHAQEDSGVLGRRREIRQLKIDLARHQARNAGLDLRWNSLELRSGVLETRRRRLSNALDSFRDREREVTLQERSSQSETDRLQARLKNMQTEHERLQTRLKEVGQALKQSEDALLPLSEEAEQLEQRIHTNSVNLQQAEEIRRQTQDQLATLRAEHAGSTEKVSSLRRDAERLTHLEHNLEQNIARLAADIETGTTASKELAGSAESLSQDLKKMHQQHEALSAESHQKNQACQEAIAQSRGLEGTISALQRDLRTHREKQHQTDLAIKERQSQRDQIRHRLLEEQKTDVEAMGPIKDEAFNPETAEAQVTQLRNAIQRLGPVHLGVLDAFEKEQQRLDFFTQQRDDLLTAAEDLKKSLAWIDRKARKLFKDTFEAIRIKFHETFARFFPGGEATLSLEDDVDPLEARVEISARPQGKRLQSIALLSGGERALTAISLLFAIYQVKPSPFCILDEVDAPLDDANVERFVHVLKEFALDTQFIVVTHNKITMSAGDTLHGVTMPEEGVSKIVSVQMGLEDQLLDEAAG
jgi:chromosome segregation protein